MKIPSDAARAQARFDAVIVGAGSAGAAAAIALARAGWSVALVEQQRFPRTRVCGECLVAGCQPLLAALGVAAELDGRAGTGAVYWEGLSELTDSKGQRVGLGYLEMTGYTGALTLG